MKSIPTHRQRHGHYSGKNQGPEKPFKFFEIDFKLRFAQNFKKYGQHRKQEPAVKLKVQKELDGDIEKSRLISHGRHCRAQAPDP